MSFRHLLSHTSGITGIENEEIMEYYNALGNKKGTLIMRYFMSEDLEIRAEALGEVREVMGSVVGDLYLVSPIRESICADQSQGS